MPFSGLGDDFDSLIDDIPAVPAATPATVPSSETKPAAVAQPAPATAPPQVEVPAAASVPQPPAVPSTAPDANAQPAAASAAPAAPEAPTDVPPAEIDQFLTLVNERAAEVTQQLVPQFQLTPEQITELETDAAAAVPKLLANTYLKAVTSTVAMMKSVVPQMIQQTVVQQEVARQMEADFFKQWNLLDRTKHGNDIRTFAQAISATNPRITQQELFSLVGAAVMAKHGLSAAPASVPQQRAPASGFTPAVASAPVTHQKPIQDSNPFAGMGFSFDDE